MWITPPSNLDGVLPEFSHDTVHLWYAELQPASQSIEQFSQLLSTDERERADRFRFPHHRCDFIVARGILRSLLSRYISCHPAQIQFAYGEHGKPRFRDATLNSRISFNLSHTSGVALYAIARHAIGVDVELVRPVQVSQVAERFFSVRESALLKALPPDQQTRAFFRTWTQKEAYLKATGEGLGGLSQVELAVSPDAPAQFVAIADHPDRVTHWTLRDLAIAENYAAAVAIAAPISQIHYWRWGVDLNDC